ncbi:MAG: hypothetical protein PHN98_07750 [Smithellaceae bacterium]|nr:hypothetical protein [Smithellaceae bacterium]
MPMLIRRIIIPAALGMMLTVMLFSFSAFTGGKEAPPEERPVAYKIMHVRDYQVFLKNWDETKDPVLYAMISNPTQYNDLFHPAPIMGSRRPFSPDESLYSRDDILVVGRVVPYPENIDKVFDVDRITERNQELSLYYRFHEKTSDVKWQGKICLAIRIPKRSYKKVHFFENGTKVGELNPEAGQWSHPARIPEPGNSSD